MPPVSGARTRPGTIASAGAAAAPTLYGRPLTASRKLVTVYSPALPCFSSIGPQKHAPPAAASGTRRWVMSDMPISGLPPAAIRSRSMSGSSCPQP